MSKRSSDSWGNALLVLLAPFVLAWTSYCFWRLAIKGTLYVRDHGDILEVSSGFNFWLTLVLYVLLFCGALVVLYSFMRWLRRRRAD